MKLFGKILANRINIYTFAENLRYFCFIHKKYVLDIRISFEIRGRPMAGN